VWDHKSAEVLRQLPLKCLQNLATRLQCSGQSQHQIIYQITGVFLCDEEFSVQLPEEPLPGTFVPNPEVEYPSEMLSLSELQSYNTLQLQRYFTKVKISSIKQFLQHCNLPTIGRKPILVSQIITFLAPSHQDNNIVAKINSDILSNCFTDFPSQHQVYRDYFNGVDLANKIYYRIPLPHQPSIWTSRMLFGLLQASQ
jgi:hypothetical protein